jgi:hypothetical protein
MKTIVNTDVTNILEQLISEYVQLHTLPTPGNIKYHDFIATQIPTKDVPHKAVDNIHHICTLTDTRLSTVTSLLNANSCTNAICYAPYSSMSWHTNSDTEGTRTYYIYSKRRSVFRYKNPITGLVHNDEDNIGWTARSFTIDKQKPLWHTIWSEGYRFAFGFNSHNKLL